MKLLLPWVVGSCVVCVTSPAIAQDKLGSPLDELFRLRAGVFSADTASEVRLDADDGTTGTDVSLEDDLGLRDHSDVGDVEVELRIRQRHRVRFNYFKLDRNATETIDRQIRFGNDVYEPGDTVESAIDLRNFAVTYAYEFMRSDRYEIGAGLGVSLNELTADAAVRARGIAEDETRAVPIPVIGLDALFRFSDRIHAQVRGEYLHLNLDDIDGTVINLRGEVVYRFNRTLGVGLGYTMYETEVDSEKPGDTGRFYIENSGGLAFFRVSF